MLDMPPLCLPLLCLLLADLLNLKILIWVMTLEQAGVQIHKPGRTPSVCWMYAQRKDQVHDHYFGLKNC